MSYLENVPLAQLEPHPHNVRRDLGDLTELAESIRGIGLLEPLIVAPKGKPGEGFVVIGGHRRLAAAKEAGLEGVPCIMRADLCTPAAQIEAMLTENLQRTDLTVMEEADAYEQLALLGVTDTAICKATGRAPRTVRERRLLASLPTPRRTEFENGKLSLDGAVQCAKLREKWADDAEILEAIDTAQTWAFGSESGLNWRIERILDSRKPEPEPDEDEDEPDEDGLDLDGRRSAWEERQRVADARAKALEPMLGRAQEWLQAALESDGSIVGRLVDWAIAQGIYEYDMEGVLPWFGIDKPGQDEDVDDAHDRMEAAALALPYHAKVTALALCWTGANLEPSSWRWEQQTKDFVEFLGYVPSPEEAALLTPEVDDEVAS